LKIYNNNILVPLGVMRLSTFFILLLVGFLSFVGFVILINKA
jgi:hypothetical protein